MQGVEIPNSPRLLNVAELAELLKVKPRTIHEMVAQNHIPYRKPLGSNILRFALDECALVIAIELVVLFSRFARQGSCYQHGPEHKSKMRISTQSLQSLSGMIKSYCNGSSAGELPLDQLLRGYEYLY